MFGKTKKSPSTRGNKSPEAQYALLKILCHYYGWTMKVDEKSELVVYTGIKRK